MQPFLDFLTDVRVAAAGILAILSSCLATTAEASFINRNDPSYASVARFTIGDNNTDGEFPTNISLAMPDLVFPDAQDTAWEMSIYFTVDPPPPPGETAILPGSAGWWWYWSNGAQYPDPWVGGAYFIPVEPTVDPTDGFLFPNTYEWRAHFSGFQPDMGAVRWHINFSVPVGYTIRASAILETQEVHAPEPATMGLMLLGALVGLRRPAR